MNREAFKLARDTLRTAVREYGWRRSDLRYGRRWYTYGPGRFEGEHWSIVYFYDLAMNGMAGESFGDDERTHCDIDCDIVSVSSVEREAFQLSDDTMYVAIEYSESGFVSMRELTTAQYQMLAASYAEPEYAVDVWEERDRLHIHLTGTDGTDLSWWDDDARQMFEDGFFDARNLEESVIEYARERGLLGSQS